MYFVFTAKEKWRKKKNHRISEQMEINGVFFPFFLSFFFLCWFFWWLRCDHRQMLRARISIIFANCDRNAHINLHDHKTFPFRSNCQQELSFLRQKREEEKKNDFVSFSLVCHRTILLNDFLTLVVCVCNVWLYLTSFTQIT